MRSKLLIKLILMSILGGMIIAACEGQSASPSDEVAEPSTPKSEGFSVTDALNRTVTFDQPPERIAMPGKGVIMLADALYAFPKTASRLVVITKTDQGSGNFTAAIDPDYGSKTILEGDAGVEPVAAVQPDVVLLKSYLAEKLGKQFETLGIPVVYLDFETPEQYERDLITLGQIFQNEARANELVTFFQDRVDSISSRVDDLGEDQKPRVLILYYTDRDGEVAFNVPPLTWMQAILVQTAGGYPVWQEVDLGNGWTKVNFEQIAAWDADQVYIVAYHNDVEEVVSGLKDDPQWQALRALQQDQLYAFPVDFYSWDQPDTRWILGLSWLATKMHPDRFSDIDIMQETRDFYQVLYSLDDAAFEEIILPKLRGDIP